MKPFVFPGLAVLAAVGCCLLLPVLVSTAGIAAIMAWGSLGVLIVVSLVAVAAWLRPRLPKATDADREDCCAPTVKAEKR